MEADSAPWDPSFNCVCPLVASLVLWALKLSTASTQTGEHKAFTWESRNQAVGF